MTSAHALITTLLLSSALWSCGVNPFSTGSNKPKPEEPIESYPCDPTTEWRCCDCPRPEDPPYGNNFLGITTCLRNGQCRPLPCFSNSDCAAKEVCEDSQCRSPACGADEECDVGQKCVAGKCENPVPSSAVTTCRVAPARVLLNADSTRSFQIVAQTFGGKTIPYQGADGMVTWDAGSLGTVTPDAEKSARATFSSGSKSLSGELKASVGGMVCTPAEIISFDPVPAKKTRVVVASSVGQSLITDATVTVNGVAHEMQGKDSLVLESSETPVSITVTREGFSTVTLLGVTTNDVIVYLKPKLLPVKLTGEFTARTFDNLNDIRGTVHIAIAGTSIRGGFNDFDVRTHFGEGVRTRVNLGGGIDEQLDLPEGVVAGLADNMFKKSLSVNVTSSNDTLWVFGGNVVLSDLLTAISIATGDNTDGGSVIPSLVPTLARLQSSMYPLTGVAGGGLLPTGFRPEVPLRLQTKVRTPPMPAFTVDGVETHHEGVLVLAGPKHSIHGFVPSGIMAGVDEDQNGLIDAPLNTVEGELALRLAPASGGVEGGPSQVVTLAMPLSQLAHKDEAKPFIVAGSVSQALPILFNDKGKEPIAMRPLLLPPDGLSLTLGNEASLSLAASNGVTLYRLDVDGDHSIYFPGTWNHVDLSSVPVETSSATLHALRLGLKSGVDYQSVLRFDGDNIDDLSGVTDAFVVRPLTSQEITRSTPEQ